MGLFRHHAPAPDVCDRCGHIAGMHVNTVLGCRQCDCPRSPGQVLRHIDPDGTVGGPTPHGR
ncbi:hypothetical protein [Flexivirga sp.]|uniref:hypothetical protein n=1 Tax=Flexivirga sp. TaxID=1962927 RepID=UPI003F7E4254